MYYKETTLFLCLIKQCHAHHLLICKTSQFDVKFHPVHHPLIYSSTFNMQELLSQIFGISAQRHVPMTFMISAMFMLIGVGNSTACQDVYKNPERTQCNYLS